MLGQQWAQNLRAILFAKPTRASRTATVRRNINSFEACMIEIKIKINERFKIILSELNLFRRKMKNRTNVALARRRVERFALAGNARNIRTSLAHVSGGRGAGQGGTAWEVVDLGVGWCLQPIRARTSGARGGRLRI